MEAALDYAAEDADVTGRLYRLLKAAPRHRAHGHRLRDPGTPPDSGAGSDGAHRHPRRRRRPRGAERRFYDAPRRPRRGNPRPCRAPVQRRLAQAVGRGAVRRDGAGGRQEGQDRRLRHRRRPCSTTSPPRATTLPARVLDAATGQAQEHLHRRPGSRNQPRHRARAYLVRQAVAATGRLSSSDPNLQNILVRTEEGPQDPARLRARQRVRLLSADYSQIELRLLAYVAGIEVLRGTPSATASTSTP